jgi:hypothetical protein
MTTNDPSTSCPTCGETLSCECVPSGAGIGGGSGYGYRFWCKRCTGSVTLGSASFFDANTVCGSTYNSPIPFGGYPGVQEFDEHWPKGAGVEIPCPLVFKGPACHYAGSETHCNKMFSRCRELDNTDNYQGSIVSRDETRK